MKLKTHSFNSRINTRYYIHNTSFILGDLKPYESYYSPQEPELKAFPNTVSVLLLSGFIVKLFSDALLENWINE
jgi:hypothetical protein